MMDPNEKVIIFLTDQMHEIIADIIKRKPSAIATALIFAMSEVIMRRLIEEPAETRLSDIMQKAGEEALSLVDSVYMAESTSTKEVLH
jgi:type III secretory pathway component EscU